MKNINALIFTAAILTFLGGCKTYEPLEKIDWSKEAENAKTKVRLSSLEDAEKLALVGNMMLNKMRCEAAGADDVVKETGWWEDPEVGFDLSRIVDPTSNPFQGGASATFTIPISQVYKLEKKAARAYAASERAKIAAAENFIAFEARKIAAALFFIEEKKRVLQAFESDASILKAIADTEKLFLAREYTLSALNSVKRRKHERDHTLMELDDERIAREREFRAIAGLLSSAEIEISFILKDPEISCEKALSCVELARHPAVKAALAELNLKESELETEIRKQYPDLKIGTTLSLEKDNDKAGAFAGMSVPLWNRNRKAIALASKDRATKREEALGVWKDITVEAKAAEERLSSLLSHPVAPASEETDAAGLLDAGELTPLEYLEIREEILALALENVKWKRAVTLAREELAKYKVTLED